MIRQPILALLAITSAYFLPPYSGSDFWILLGIHTLIATAVSVVDVWFLTRYLFLLYDEIVGHILTLRCMSWIASLGGIGQSLAPHLKPALTPMAPTIMALQNEPTRAPPPGRT